MPHTWIYPTKRKMGIFVCTKFASSSESNVILTHYFSLIRGHWVSYTIFTKWCGNGNVPWLSGEYMHRYRFSAGENSCTGPRHDLTHVNRRFTHTMPITKNNYLQYLIGRVLGDSPHELMSTRYIFISHVLNLLTNSGSNSVHISD